MDPNCPELELLLDQAASGRGPALEHARGCAGCGEILEEHRQLEKDLFRLADPTPPPEFLQQVMAKVAQAPASVRAELKMAAAILLLSVGLGAAFLLSAEGGLQGLGLAFAHFFVDLREFSNLALRATATAWKTAAAPLTAAASIAMLFSLLGLRKLAQQKVTS